MQRHILHINIANFFIAVARAVQPRLLSYPVVVATPGSRRRVLLDVSHQARSEGIYKGMLLDMAKKKCPNLMVLYPSPDLYNRAQTAILKETSFLSPRVELAGPGHFFVDLTGTSRLLGVAIDTADRLRKTIENKFRLNTAVGLAQNKLVSKVATRVIKPKGLCEVMSGGEADFMAPLPISYLPGLDPEFILMLLQFNLKLISDLLFFPKYALYEAFGQKAFEIYRLAQGMDDSPVRGIKEPGPSIEIYHVFEGQTNDDEIIKNVLFKLVSKAGFRLRKMGLAAKKIKLSIKYADGVWKYRTDRLYIPLCGDLSLYESFLKLFCKVYMRRIRLTKISIKLLGLSFPYGQLDLFGKAAKEKKLMKALDIIHAKFGEKAISFYGRQMI